MWAPFNPWAQGNPSNWSYYAGQDFIAQHNLTYIDFAVIHMWPDNWDNLYGGSSQIVNVLRIGLANYPHNSSWLMQECSCLSEMLSSSTRTALSSKP